MNKFLSFSSLAIVLLVAACSPSEPPGEVAAPANVDPVPGSPEFENQVEEYIQKFPYQDTYNYAVRYTEGNPKNLNAWVLGKEPMLVKAGDDAVVRMNNDTYYKLAFVDLRSGPVVVASNEPRRDRFVSFQLMDDRNANYRNVISPQGAFTLYRGARPETAEGELIEVPSDLSVVIVRVEVRDENDEKDLAAAQKIFNGITIYGPKPPEFLVVDLLSAYSNGVVAEGDKRLDAAFAEIPFRLTVVGPGEEPGTDVPYLNHSAGTKGGWGGPGTEHSSYETIFADGNGETLDGSKGAYTVTTEPPPVAAFWSLTVYDTARGGFLHPNKDNRYHINNTTAVSNRDKTVTFNFKTSCGEDDRNCLEVPAGPFDVVARYYLPSEAIQSGEWELPAISLVDEPGAGVAEVVE